MVKCSLFYLLPICLVIATQGCTSPATPTSISELENFTPSKQLLIPSSIESIFQKSETQAGLNATHLNWIVQDLKAASERSKVEQKPILIFYTNGQAVFEKARALFFDHVDFKNFSEHFVLLILDGCCDSDVGGHLDFLKGQKSPTFVQVSPEGFVLQKTALDLTLKEFIAAHSFEQTDDIPANVLIEKVLYQPSVPMSVSDWDKISLFDWVSEGNSYSNENRRTLFSDKVMCIYARIPKALKIQKSRIAAAFLELEQELSASYRSASGQQSVTELFNAIFHSPETIFANRNFIIEKPFLLVSMVKTLDKQQGQALKSKWLDATDLIFHNGSLDAYYRLWATFPELTLFNANNTTPIKNISLLNKFRKNLENLRSESFDGRLRIDIAFDAARILTIFNAFAEAKELLVHERALSDLPWLYESELAFLSVKSGKYSEAKEWSRKSITSSPAGSDQLKVMASDLILNAHIFSKQWEKSLHSQQRSEAEMEDFYDRLEAYFDLALIEPKNILIKRQDTGVEPYDVLSELKNLPVLREAMQRFN